MEAAAASGPIAKQLQRVCHDTLPGPISVSLDLMTAAVARSTFKGVRLIDSLPFARKLYPSYAIEHEYRRRY